MKKVIIVMVLISLVLVGCSNKSEDTLRVGMDLRFYPFTGMDSNGDPSGVEVDIAEALAEYLGKDIEIVNTEFPMLIPALQSEAIDIIIGSMSITDEREKTVDFSQPYLYDKIVALVNMDYAKANGITDDMSVEEFFSHSNTKFIGITGSIAVTIPESYGFKVESVTSDAVAEREIANGSSDVLIGAYTLYGMHDTNKASTLMYKNAIEASSIGMAVKEGNTVLLNKTNEFIKQMKSSGLNDRLSKEWNTAIGKKLFDERITLDYYLNLE